METYGKTAVFFPGFLWPDWGNTARAARAGLESIGHVTARTCIGRCVQGTVSGKLNSSNNLHGNL